MIPPGGSEKTRRLRRVFFGCSPIYGKSAANGSLKSKTVADVCADWAGAGGLAGHAVNPAPRSGPAAGGWAFGRMRGSASQAIRPHPWGLGENIHVFDSPANPPTPTLHTWLARMGKRRSEPRSDNVIPERNASDHGSDLPTMGLPELKQQGLPLDGRRCCCCCCCCCCCPRS